MDPTSLVKVAKEHWPTPLGIALSWVAVIACGALASAILPQVAAIVAVVVVGLILTAIWFSQRRIKTCPKGLFGFVIAIPVDDQQTLRLFERDFVQRLRTLLQTGSLRDKVWVYAIPQFHLKHVPSEQDATEIRRRTGAGFVLYGDVRTRVEDVRKHYIDLNGLVAHAPTTDENKKRLVKEFTELLVKRAIAPEGAELPMFELTSALSSLTAKYIAGIGAFLSGGLDSAEAMYADALQLARPLAADHEAAKKIAERIPVRLAEVYLARAVRFYQRWKDSRSNADLRAMVETLDAAPEKAHEFPQWKALRAIGMVAEAGDDFSHIEKLVRQAPLSDPVTHMNLAFVLILKGDLRAATRHYRRAAELKVSMDTIDEVMSFLIWFRAYRPSHICQTNFALGYISYHLLGDATLASEFFTEFAKTDEFSEERALVPKWLAELGAEAA